MKFFSELTNKLYDTPESCAAAEAEYQAAEEAKAAEERRKIEERAQRKAEVDEAFAAMEEAKSYYYDLLNAYCADYGAYERTKTTNGTTESLADLFLKVLG